MNSVCVRSVELDRCIDLLCLAYCQCVFVKWYWSLFSRYAAWFSVSTFGTIILSLIGVWYLLKHVFINFEYDDEEEGEE